MHFRPAGGPCIGEECVKPDRMIDRRIFDFPVAKIVGGNGFGHLFPAARMGMARKRLAGILKRFRPQHGTVVGAPLGVMEDEVDASRKVTLNDGAIRRVHSVARSYLHIRAREWRQEEEV